MTFLVAMPADARRSFGPGLIDELAVKASGDPCQSARVDQGRYEGSV
jgi:hypothetical protein